MQTLEQSVSNERGHKKMFIYDIDGTGRNFKEIEDYFIYYYGLLHIETMETYKDTIEIEGNMVDRYLVDFYRNGQKVDVETGEKYCGLSFKDDRIPKAIKVFDDPYNAVEYCSFDRNVWGVKVNTFKYFTIGFAYALNYRTPGNAEALMSISKDELGNIVINLDNEVLFGASSLRDRVRNTGDKFYILANCCQNSVDGYLKTLKEIADKKYSNAWMFDIIIGDPRVKAELERLLGQMKSISPEVHSENQKSIIDKQIADLTREYEKKIRALEAKKAQIEQYEYLTEQFPGGIVPKASLRKSSTGKKISK